MSDIVFEPTNNQEGLYAKYILRKSDGSFIDSKAKYFILRYDADSTDGC